MNKQGGGPTAHPQAAMPKWLLYKLVATIVIVVLITAAALLYAGILG